MLTDTSLSWQSGMSHMSIEQYTIGAAVTWGSTQLSPIGYCQVWHIVALVNINHLHSWFVTCTVHIIIIMYLDPCVSINCKYKLDQIFDLIWSFNMVSEVKESNILDNFWPIFKDILNKFQQFVVNFRPILRTLWTISSEFKAFFLRGGFGTLLVKGERKGERGKRSSARNTLVHSWWKERTIHQHTNPVVKGKWSGTSGTLA